MTAVCTLLSNKSSFAQTFPNPPVDLDRAQDEGRLVLSGGCFWCTEAVYRQLVGVINVTSGYAGGTAETADYAAVSGGTTDHAEAVLIEYDPLKVTFGAVLKVFFSVAHNPTHRDRQGEDVGRHYRSTVFFETPKQQRIVEAYIAVLDATHVFDAPIATTLEPLKGFFPAEADLQDYVARNPSDPYVVKTSLPKVKKTRAWYTDSLKDQSG